MAERSRELDIPEGALEDAKAEEVLRAWTGDKAYVCVTGRLYKEPGVWGVLFWELARHVARAYALNNYGDRDEALSAIRERFIAAFDEDPDESTGHLVDD